MKHDAVIDSLPIYNVSNSAKLGYAEKETWIKLDWNESPRNASPKVIAAINEFLRDRSLAYYPDVTSNELISAIAEQQKVPKECISVFNGSDNALQHIFYTFLSKDTLFTTIQPTYTQILQFVNFKGGTSNFYFPDNVLDIDYERFESDYVRGSDVAYLINPHNPTGHLLSRDFLHGLARRNPGTLFVIDEAYMEFASSDESCISLVETQRNIVVTRTFSKAYGLAGIRLGYAATHRDNLDMVRRIKNEKDINTLAQIAGAAAVADVSYLEEHVKIILENRKWFIDNVPRRYSPVNSEANFVLINYKDDPRLVERFEESRILVRDRSDQHGLHNYLRVTIGTKDQMERVVSVLTSLGSEAGA